MAEPVEIVQTECDRFLEKLVKSVANLTPRQPVVTIY